MLLALFVEMTGRVDPAHPMTAAHQPRPLEFGAAVLGLDMVEMDVRVSLPIRLPDGWTAPAGRSPARHSRYAVDPVAPMPALACMVKTIRYVVAFDFPETDRALRLWRAQLGRDPAWLGSGPKVIDLAADAAALMAIQGARCPSLEEATASILGERITGLAGVLALNASPQMQAMRRRAA